MRLSLLTTTASDGEYGRCPICHVVSGKHRAGNTAVSAADCLRIRVVMRGTTSTTWRLRYRLTPLSDTEFYYPPLLVTEYTLTNLRKSTRKRGHGRGDRCDRCPSKEPPWAGVPVRVPSFSGRLGFAPQATRLVKRSRGPLSADIASKAAETLRCASGGGPAASASAAATRDRRDRERQAGRSRGGRGAVAGVSHRVIGR